MESVGLCVIRSVQARRSSARRRSPSGTSVRKGIEAQGCFHKLSATQGIVRRILL
jgi:hypothetical protein